MSEPSTDVLPLG